jgi:hypothetical protein
MINQWDNMRCMATIQATMNNLPSILHDSALAWAKVYYQTDQVVVAIILEEGDEPDRYLALIAAANQTGWQAAEVWLEDGRVVAINDLGEGIPPDGVTWPW